MSEYSLKRHLRKFHNIGKKAKKVEKVEKQKFTFKNKVIENTIVKPEILLEKREAKAKSIRDILSLPQIIKTEKTRIYENIGQIA